MFKDLDAPWCPEMVVIPAGQFLMGSPPDEPERFDAKGPQHRVTIGYRFALGRYAVSVSEYAKFAEATSSAQRTAGRYILSPPRLPRRLLGRRSEESAVPPTATGRAR